MFIVIYWAFYLYVIYFPVCEAINFEINKLSDRAAFLHDQNKSDKNLNMSRTKRAV